METIIYTNNKRQGSNYQVDRIVYSEGMDAKQIIQNQMERENISHIHFWFVRENLSIDNGKESNLLINFGKYLIENKQGNFKFQYIVERYNEEKKENKQDYPKSYHNIDYNESTSQRVKRDEDSLKLQKSSLHRDQLIRQEIKFGTFRDFQAFIRKEMNSNLDSDIMKKYLFRTKQQSIAVSFFQSFQLKTIQRIIQEDSDQIYNAKLLFRKISTIHPQDFQKNKKKIQNYEEPIQLYHRLILFLFTPQKVDDIRDTKRKRTFNSIRYGVTNKIQANQSLSLWRVKQQVDALLKYQKQCDLIKQEIENEKMIFRNKIKLIENYIGDSINVEKLFQEEEQLVIGSSITAQANNTFSASINKKNTIIGKRSSLSSNNGQILSNLQKLSRFNQANNTANSFLIVSEFKRLKQISETIRNIDNTIVQQNRKKQQLQKRVKQLAKEKQELLFRNAKQLNEIKRGTVDIKKDIERKQNQIKQKYQSGEFKLFLSYKNRQPSELAKQSLKDHIIFLNQYQQQSRKANGTILNEFDELQDVKEKKQRQTNRNIHRSEFKDVTNINAMNLMQKRSNQAKKTKQTINQHTGLSKSTYKGYKNISKSSHILNKNIDGPHNKHLEKQLLNLFEYYKSNKDILEEASKQLLNYHRVSHKSSKSNQNSISGSEFNLELHLSELPLLEQIIQQKSFRKSGYKIPSKQPEPAIQPKIQSIYGQDYFSLMINSNTKTKPNSTVPQKNNMTSLKQAFFESFSDINNIKAPSIELLQKNLVNSSAKVSKFKRITIQQAINKSQLLKKVRINSKEDD